MSLANPLYKELHIPPFLNPQSIGDLTQQLSDITEQTRFLILKGSAAVFCDGLDLRWVANNDPSGFKKEILAYGNFLKQLQSGNCISIAVVSGTVSGGGMGIVCSCDHVIATEASTFSLPEGLLGLIPGMILPSLLNRMSPQVIKKMVFTGQKYSATAARDFNIVDDITSSSETEAALTKAIHSMRSCKKDSVGDLKGLLSNAHLDKDQLGQFGIDILLSKLTDPDMRERLKDLSDFMGEE